MKEHRLLIADASEDFCLSLAHRLEQDFQIRCCYDGAEALRLLQKFRPTLVILDLMLPGIDGISLISNPAFRELHPQVLATTRFFSNYILESVNRLEISYLILKPCEFSAVAERLKEMAPRSQVSDATPADPQTLTAALLQSLGVSPKLHGYTYLMAAIPLLASAPDQMITKELYPAVAECCGTAPSHVERSIRNAIDKARNQADPEIWQQFFPGIQKPSNSQFILRLAEALNQDL